MAKVAVVEKELLDEHSVVDSLQEEILRMPFENNLGEVLYPVCAERTGRNTVSVEMVDGTKFLLIVSKT